MLTQLMIARLMSHPAGLVKKAWRKTLRRAAPVESEPIETAAPPRWPDRFRGAGISLFAADAQVAASTSVLNGPPRAGAAAIGKLPFAAGHLSYDDHAASFLEPHAL